MTLSAEFQGFYDSWLRKADEYSSNGVRDCFDKYFTLFVIFNRLYAEAAFILARRNQIRIAGRTSFPDANAAKSYVSQYLTSSFLVFELDRDQETRVAIERIKALIDHETFYIKLDMVTGDRCRTKDLELLENLRSTNSNKKAVAILDILYSIRCNMFHGHKGFEGVQVRLLRPAIIILRKVIELLYGRLMTDNG